MYIQDNQRVVEFGTGVPSGEPVAEAVLACRNADEYRVRLLAGDVEDMIVSAADADGQRVQLWAFVRDRWQLLERGVILQDLAVPAQYGEVLRILADEAARALYLQVPLGVTGAGAAVNVDTVQREPG
ncbi:MAG: hypothetical protein ACPGVG_00370 [Mycobacterium sp.]